MFYNSLYFSSKSHPGVFQSSVQQSETMPPVTSSGRIFSHQLPLTLYLLLVSTHMNMVLFGKDRNHKAVQSLLLMKQKQY